MHRKESFYNMNILVTLNSGYIKQLKIMLSSLKQSNQSTPISLCVLHSSLTDGDIKDIASVLSAKDSILPIRANADEFSNAPTTDRYPFEMYYRIFAADYLPSSLDRILYLDPDIIVKGSLSELYNMPLEKCLIAAASHVGKVMTKINTKRLSDEKNDIPYINSGVMLMNLERLRKEQSKDRVFEYIEKYKERLILPDQDIISGLYGNDITLIDPYIYNMTERMFALHPDSQSWLNLKWVKENSVIIHYCGRNKPWKSGYVGSLDVFYKQAEEIYKLNSAN